MKTKTLHTFSLILTFCACLPLLLAGAMTVLYHSGLAGADAKSPAEAVIVLVLSSVILFAFGGIAWERAS